MVGLGAMVSHIWESLFTLVLHLMYIAIMKTRKALEFSFPFPEHIKLWML